jgi:hypothetical protein
MYAPLVESPKMLFVPAVYRTRVLLGLVTVICVEPLMAVRRTCPAPSTTSQSVAPPAGIVAVAPSEVVCAYARVNKVPALSASPAVSGVLSLSWLVLRSRV